jgi:hypothetical protein
VTGTKEGKHTHMHIKIHVPTKETRRKTLILLSINNRRELFDMARTT